MNSRFGLVLLSFVFAVACTSKPAHDPVPPQQPRRTASEDGLFWIPHPCGLKGTPFSNPKKYQFFALDEQAGVLYSRGTGERETVAATPKNKKYWDSVSEFFEAQGIYAACAKAQGQGAGPQQPKPPKPPKPPVAKPDQPVPPTPNQPSEPNQPTGGFKPPVQTDLNLYYKNLFDQTVPQGQDPKAAFKSALFFFLSRPHLQAPGRADEVISACPAQGEEGVTCVEQRRWNYEIARRHLFGSVDIRKNADGTYEVFDHYCQRWLNGQAYRDQAVASRNKPPMEEDEVPGPNNIPYHLLTNTEHVWPQSKFTHSAPEEVQKTDLHHLLSTDTQVNALRANFEYAEVTDGGAQRGRCGEGRLGQAISAEGALPVDGQKYFEPPRVIRGDIARALFYFAARYNAGMSALQEAYLRKWNKEDLPDDAEKARHEKVYQLQGLRNPFVDDPNLADRMPRLCRAKLTAADAQPLERTFDCP